MVIALNPVLSRGFNHRVGANYNIEVLNMRHNKLNTLSLDLLPPSIKSVDVRNNRIRQFVVEEM
ncbi:hypothetical protein SARC_18132, partial [Sphaeroforma arctica JP610]